MFPGDTDIPPSLQNLSNSPPTQRRTAAFLGIPFHYVHSSRGVAPHRLQKASPTKTGAAVGNGLTKPRRMPRCNSPSQGLPRLLVPLCCRCRCPSHRPGCTPADWNPIRSCLNVFLAHLVGSRASIVAGKPWSFGAPIRHMGEERCRYLQYSTKNVGNVHSC